MKFPVDLLADVSQAELERLAHDYMNNLLYSNPDCPDHLALSNSTQVTIDISSVGFVPLYGSSDKQKILALFSPSDPFTAVALYLLDRWWAVDEILKTVDPTRVGAVEVETVGERIVLYILNRVVYRAKEMSPEELPFLCHGEKDNAKILWNDGEAVGFYSVKPSGSFWNSFSTRSYQLPVMDSIFVRKGQRGKGFGLQMLEDFVLSFKEDCLGLRYPVTKFMYKVCEKYLCQYPGDTDLLWEVESIGGPKQRTNIARKIQAMDQSVSRSLTFTEESLMSSERTENDVMTEAIATQIKEAGSMECTVEIVEEVTVLHVTKVSEVEVPLTARGRSNGSKRRKMGEKIGEDKSEKVIRIEDIEAESPIKDQVSAQQKTELHSSELGISSVAPEEEGEDMVNTAPEDGAKMLDQPDTILAQEDQEEADVTSAPTTEEPQLEDDAPQHLNSISCDSQITVENVASEIEEECQEEDTAALAVSEEALEEAETLDKVGEGTQVGVTDEKTEETVTQRQACLSTCATSENGEAGKTGIANVEAVTTIQTITPRQRYKRHSTVTIEEKQCEVSEICADIDADTPGGDDAEGNLPLAEVDESMSYEEEEAPVFETRAMRRKTKTNTATPRRKSTRGRKQVDAQAENSEEEPAVTTRTLRRGRISTTDTPKGKSRGRCKQIQEETQKGEEEYKRVEETGVVAEAAVEKTDEVMEEIVDTVKETENEEGIELKIDDLAEQKPDAVEDVAEQKPDAVEDVAEEKTDAVEDVAEEKPDAVEDVAEEKPDAVEYVAEEKPDAVEDVAEEKPDAVEDVEEEKPDAVEDVAEEKPDAVEDVAEEKTDAVEDVAEEKTDAVEDVAEENKDAVEDVADQKPDAVEDVADQKPDAVEDVAEEKQDAEEVITGLRSDPPTEVDVQKALEDEIEAENEDLVTAEVESEEGAMTMTVEEEDTAGVTAAADDLVQAVTDAPLPSPPTDSAVLPPVQEATPSAEEQQSEDMASQRSDLRRVTVVLVDLQKPHHDIQEEAAATEEGLPVEKTSAEAEEEATKIQDPGEGRDEETANEDEAKSVNVEEQKPMATETRTPRSGKQAVKDTPRTRGRPRKSQVKKGAAPDIQTEEPAVQVRVLRTGRKSLPIAQRSTTKRTHKQLQEEGGEESTAVEVREEEEEQQMTDQEKEEGLEERDATEQVKNTEAEMALEKEDIVAVQGQDAMEDQSEGISQTSAERQVEVSGEEYNEIKSSSGAEKVELPPVAATRSLRSGGKMSKALPKTRSKQSKTQSDEEEVLEPPVVTTILNRERKSVRRSHKQLQKTEKGPEESVEEAEVQEEEEAGLGLAENPPTEVDVQKAPEEDEKEVENEDLVTAEVESEEGTMTMTVEEEDTAGVTAAADDLVQAVTDAPLPSPPTDSAVLPPVQEATPSAEEQQSEDMASQRSDLRRVTVVLVDLQKPHHNVQQEAAATEDGLPLEKTSADAEEEQREETMKESETVAQENVPGSPVGIDKTELEERCEDEVEAVTKQDTEEARDEETEEAVEATPRTRCRLRKVRKEAASEIKTEDPAVQVRVSSTGSTTKRTCKQLQEEEEVEEESTAIEAKEEEEQITDQEKEESREVENIEAEITLEKDDIVAEDAVNQHDAQEEGRVDKTETVADEDTEASIEQHDHAEKTFIVAEEAVDKQCTVEGKQSTSTSEVAERAQETMFSEKDEQANYASEEEAPVVERVLRSGEKTMRATTRSKTTKKLDEQEEKAPGEKSTEGNEPAVKIRVLRKGRKPAEAAPRRKSKRARTQCQTEEGGEKEPTSTEEIEGEEEEAGQESPEEKGIELEEIEKEEEAHNADGEESTVGDAELTKDASTAEAGVLEAEDSVEAVDVTGTDTSLPSSVKVEETNSAVEEETAVVEQPTAAAEVGSDAAIAEKEALVEEASLLAEEDPAATTRAFRSKQKVSPATPSPRRQKDDSLRRSVRKRPKVDYRENNEGDRDETEGNTDEEKEVPVASDEDQGTKTSECSSNANEVGEAIGSSQEDEDYEQNTSEEEEEPIVIGKRVLRGRSVPSVIITPQSKSRRRSAKVLNEEESPQSAQKRKITEVTRKSKCLSRV